MSTVSGPFTILPTGAGSRVQMKQPDSANQLGALVLDNLSTYILQVSVGPNVFYQAPLVEAKYDLTTSFGQPVNVSAIQPAGDVTTSGQLAPTWYGIGEQLAGIWPIALSGPAEVAAAVAAALLNSGIPNVLSSTVIATNQSAPGGSFLKFDVHQYASLELVAGVTLALARLHYGLTVVFATDNTFAEIIDSYAFGEAPPTGPGWTDSYVIPVTGPWVGLFVNSGDPTDSMQLVSLIGTNRPSPLGASDQFPGVGIIGGWERWTQTQTFTIGSVFSLSGSWAYVGRVALVMSLTDPWMQGILTMQYAEAGGNGNLIEIPIFDTADLIYAAPGSNFVSGTSVAGTPTYARSGRIEIDLPATGRGIYFRCYAQSAGVATMEVDLMQARP